MNTCRLNLSIFFGAVLFILTISGFSLTIANFGYDATNNVRTLLLHYDFYTDERTDYTY